MEELNKIFLIAKSTKKTQSTLIKNQNIEALLYPQVKKVQRETEHSFGYVVSSLLKV